MVESTQTNWYMNAENAYKFDQDLMDKEQYSYSLQQLMELAGLSVAQATHDFWGAKESKRILVVCGPGNNGGDGIVAARHLQMFGYQCSLLYPKPTQNQFFKDLIN